MTLPWPEGVTPREGMTSMTASCWAAVKDGTGIEHERCIDKWGSEVRGWCACPCHDAPPEVDDPDGGA